MKDVILDGEVACVDPESGVSVLSAASPRPFASNQIKILEYDKLIQHILQKTFISRSAIFLNRYRNKIVFYVIKGSTIKKFIIFDLFTSTVTYYLLKALFPIVIVAIIGSFIIPEGFKRMTQIDLLKLQVVNKY